MTESQERSLRSHLFPGDGLEAVALLLCGRRAGADRHVFCVQHVVEIPYDECDRSAGRVTWPTFYVDRLLDEAYGRGMAVVKIHGHPGGFKQFSAVDDFSDRRLFSAVSSLMDDGLRHASVLMMPDGELLGRVLDENGEPADEIVSLMVVGDEIVLWPRRELGLVPAYALRHAQAFGKGTAGILRDLSIAVVGCSGTGSIVVEQLARLGVGRIVLVDHDIVEEKNLNRILNSGKEDAYLRRAKVEVLASAIARMGLGQEVVPLHQNLIDVSTLNSVAECDVVFGCMDGVEGRHWLNRLSTFYSLPYFDVGVRLEADKKGGIDHISGAAHYIQPGRSSLLSRGVYTMSRVEAEEMARTNPEMYRRQVDEGYLKGIDENRPAVVSINMLLASIVVNDFLSRLHPYRNLADGEYAYIGMNLSEMQIMTEPESEPCQLLERHVGRGDIQPYLDRPLSA